MSNKIAFRKPTTVPKSIKIPVTKMKPYILKISIANREASSPPVPGQKWYNKKESRVKSIPIP